MIKCGDRKDFFLNKLHIYSTRTDVFGIDILEMCLTSTRRPMTLSNNNNDSCKQVVVSRRCSVSPIASHRRSQIDGNYLPRVFWMTVASFVRYQLITNKNQETITGRIPRARHAPWPLSVYGARAFIRGPTAKSRACCDLQHTPARDPCEPNRSRWRAKAE